jgi:putative transposase
MDQSLVKNYLHIIFSTKHRQKLISSAVEMELFQYMGGICKRLNCQPVKIGGYGDHVHMLCMLSKKIALMKLLEEVKSQSSKWIKSVGNELRNFYWQDVMVRFPLTRPKWKLLLTILLIKRSIIDQQVSRMNTADY